MRGERRLLGGHMRERNMRRGHRPNMRALSGLPKWCLLSEHQHVPRRRRPTMFKLGPDCTTGLCNEALANKAGALGFAGAIKDCTTISCTVSTTGAGAGTCLQALGGQCSQDAACVEGACFVDNPMAPQEGVCIGVAFGLCGEPWPFCTTENCQRTACASRACGTALPLRPGLHLRGTASFPLAFRRTNLGSRSKWAFRLHGWATPSRTVSRGHFPYPAATILANKKPKGGSAGQAVAVRALSAKPFVRPDWNRRTKVARRMVRSTKTERS